MLTRVTLLSFIRAFSVYANVIAIVFNTKNLHVLFTILQGQTSVILLIVIAFFDCPSFLFTEIRLGR